MKILSDIAKKAAEVEYHAAKEIGLSLSLDELNARMAALRKRMASLETIPAYLEAALLGYQKAKETKV